MPAFAPPVWGSLLAGKAQVASVPGGKNKAAQPVGYAWVISVVDFFYSAFFYSSTLATSGQRSLLLMSALRNSSSTSSSSCRRTMAISLIRR